MSAPSLVTLTKRADFIRASHAKRQGKAAVHLQARDREDGTPDIRVGYTCSKKVGNAVARNHAKRRLREIARLILPTSGKPGWDYVLVGRHGTTSTRDFAALAEDLRDALARIHA